MVADMLETEEQEPQEFTLVKRTTIADMVEKRDRAMVLYGKAYASLSAAALAVSDASRAAADCHPGVNNYNHHQAKAIGDFQRANCVEIPRGEDYLATARRLLDLNCWAWVVKHTKLEALMDRNAKAQLRAQMAFEPEKESRDLRNAVIDREEAAKGLPPFTVENVMATLEGFMADSANIMARGVASAFSRLDRRFRSHDGFKVGARVILANVFDGDGHFRWGETQDTLIDVERAFSVLDGDVEGDFQDAVNAIRQERHGVWGARQSEVLTRYFKIRGFKNGNAHLWFTRPDLVEEVNKVLARYYGEVIGTNEQAEPDPLGNPKRALARNFGFFPSPEAVVARIEQRAGLGTGGDILRILEPSAGTGNIARMAGKAREVSRAWEDRHKAANVYRHAVDRIEVQSDLAEGLRSLGVPGRIWCGDFLEFTPDVTGLYDRVLMNPPFDRERDIDHVMHAWKFLKPGGRLVAVMSAGVEWRETKKSVAFRAFVEKVRDRWERAFETLPERSFSSVGTNVNTCLVVLDKPEL